MFLIIVDAYSKWPDIFEMRCTTSTTTINTLRTLFAGQGIPAEIVSDYGTQFRLEDFREFMESNAIRQSHLHFIPGQMVKQRDLSDCLGKPLNLHQRILLVLIKKLNSFQCKYRITPQGTTNESTSIPMYSQNI